MADYRRGGGYNRGGPRRSGGRSGGYSGGDGGRRGGYGGGHGERGGYEGGRGRGDYGIRGGRGRGDYEDRGGRGRGDYGDRGGRGRGRGGGRGRGFGGPSDEDITWPERGIVPPIRAIAEKDKPENPFKLLKEVAGLKIERSLAYTSKPKPGTSGREIPLLANYFTLQFRFKKSMSVHHYDVTIESQISSTSGDVAVGGEGTIPGSRRRARKLEKRFNRVIVDKMVEDNNGEGGVFKNIIPVYDSGKNLYTKQKLNMKSKYAVTDEEGTRLRIEVTAAEFPGDEPSKFVVVMKHVAEIIVDPEWTIFPQEAIQFIDIVLRYGPTRNNIPVGCKIFFPNVERRPLPMNKELAFGFYQSARSCEAGLMLNVDRAASVFHKGGALLSVFAACVKDIEQFPRIPENIIRSLSKELQGMRVKVTHLGYPRKMRISGFSMQCAQDLPFTLEKKNENGEVVSKSRITVEEYFRTQYKKQLRYPHLPCMIVGSKKNARYFPLEVCEMLPDQYVAKKLHAEVLSAMTQLAASQKPNARFNEITNSLKNCIAKDGSKYNQEFGIDVNATPVQLTGRVLNPPSLHYRDTAFTPSSECWWYMQPEKRFYKSVAIKNWALVDMTFGRGNPYSDEFLEQFSKRLIETAASLGVEMGRFTPSRHHFRDTNGLKNAVFERVRPCGFQLIVFLLPDEDECYYAVKKLGDKVYEIPTQCCSRKHYNPDSRRNKLLSTAYLTNVLLKINAKMNGVNSILDVSWAQNAKIMFVGVDVTHPSPGDQYSLSIASCVGSYDNSFVRYITKLTAQDQVRREIVNLDKMMRELLDAYKKSNKFWPETIIVYRDGVSEGQFDEVMAFEVTKLKRLFEEMKINPRITYIIVQKRHHTRFLTVNKRDAALRTLNIPAGTTVDTVVTDPLKFDFFICSHHGLMGTSRPSRYWVLYDQNNFTPNDIQQITFFMCFLYPRCTRSVSIPIPVEFAHLSAYRARHHITEEFKGESSYAASISSRGSNEETKEAKQKELEQHTKKVNEAIRVNDNFSSRLYYI